MAYTFTAGALSSVVASGDITCNFPASPQTGDIFVAFLTLRSNVGCATPANWTKIHESLTGDVDATSGVASGQVFWWRYDGSGTSVTFTRTGGDRGQGVIIGVRGCLDTGDVIDAQNISTVTVSAGGSCAFPDITASASGDPRALLTFLAIGDNGTGGDCTSTTPSGGTWTEVAMANDNTGADGGGSVYYHDTGLAASTTTSTMAATSSSAATNVVSTIALKPLVGPVAVSRADAVAVSDAGTVTFTVIPLSRSDSVAVSDSGAVLRDPNPYIEENWDDGTTEGWTITTVGTGAACQVSTENPRTGSYSLKVFLPSTPAVDAAYAGSSAAWTNVASRVSASWWLVIDEDTPTDSETAREGFYLTKEGVQILGLAWKNGDTVPYLRVTAQGGGEVDTRLLAALPVGRYFRLTITYDWQSGEPLARVFVDGVRYAEYLDESAGDPLPPTYVMAGVYQLDPDGDAGSTTIYIDDILVTYDDDPVTADSLRFDRVAVSDAGTIELAGDVGGVDVDRADAGSVSDAATLDLPGETHLSVADTVSSQDSGTVALSVAPQRADGIAVSDAVTLDLPGWVDLTVADTVTAADTRTITVEGEATPLAVTGVDVLAVSDAYGGAFWWWSGLTVSDVGTVQLVSPDVIVVSLADAIGVSDSQTVGGTVALTHADTAAVTDAGALTLTPLEVAGADDVSVSDSQTVGGTFVLTLADASALSDAGTVVLTPLEATGADTVASSDEGTVALAAAGDVTVAGTDATTVSDAATLDLPGETNLSVADVVGVSDGYLGVLYRWLVVAVSDVGTVAFLAPDVLSETCADDLAVSDVGSVAVTPLLVSGADTVTGHDASTVGGSFDLARPDDVALSDASTLDLAGATDVSVADRTALSDAGSVTFDVAVLRGDAVGISDSRTTELWTWYEPRTAVATTGVLTGVVGNVYTDDGSYLTGSEVTGAPGFQYDFTWENVPPTLVRSVRFIGYYDGNPAHAVKVQQWNFTGSSWENCTAATTDIPSGTSDSQHDIPLKGTGSDYISNGTLKLRIEHTSTGNPVHQLQIDQFILLAAVALEGIDVVAASDSRTIDLAGSTNLSVADAVGVSDSREVGGSFDLTRADVAALQDVGTIDLPGTTNLAVADTLTVADTRTLDLPGQTNLLVGDGIAASDTRTTQVDTVGALVVTGSDTVAVGDAGQVGVDVLRSDSAGVSDWGRVDLITPLAYDNSSEVLRTATTDPYTAFTGYTPGAGTRGILVAAINVTTATDQISSITYGGVTLTKVVTATDTVTEFYNTSFWFLGTGIPAGAQNLVVDFSSATDDDYYFVIVSIRANADLEVIDSDQLSENRASPQVTLSYGGRKALAFCALGGGATAASSYALLANMSAVQDNAVATPTAKSQRVDRQTDAGTSDFTIGYTYGTSDDVAFVALAVAEVAQGQGRDTVGVSDGYTLYVPPSDVFVSRTDSLALSEASTVDLPGETHLTGTDRAAVSDGSTLDVRGLTNLSVGDGLALSDAGSAIGHWVLPVADAGTVSDVGWVTLDPLSAARSDGLAVSDAATHQIQTVGDLTALRTDYAALRDAITIDLPGETWLVGIDALGVADAATVAFPQLPVVVADTAALSDTGAVLLTPTLQQGADGAAVADAGAVTFLSALVTVTGADALGVSEASRVLLTPLLVAGADGLAASDASATWRDLVAPLLVTGTDDVALGDSGDVALSKQLDGTDQCALSDAGVIGLTPMLLLVADAVALSDTGKASSIAFYGVDFSGEAISTVGVINEALSGTGVTSETLSGTGVTGETIKPV